MSDDARRFSQPADRQASHQRRTCRQKERGHEDTTTATIQTAAGQAEQFPERLDREARPSASRGSPGSSISPVGILAARSPLPAVYSAMYVAGDAAATAGNLAANAGLVKRSASPPTWSGSSVVFAGADPVRRSLRHVSGDLRRARHGRPGRDRSVPQLPQHPVRVPGSCGSRPTRPTPRRSALPGSTALAMLMLDLRHYGYAIAQASSSACGSCRSATSPSSPACSRRSWASSLVVGGIGYLFDTLAALRSPELDPRSSHPVAALLGIVAEVSTPRHTSS